jgi:selenoprotein W-related protein
MSHVEIEYCVASGVLGQAEDLQHALLVIFGDELDAVTLRPRTDGAFRVSVDGEPICDRAEEASDVDEVTRQVRARV